MPTANERLLQLYQQKDFGDVLTGDPGSAPASLAGLVMNPKNAKKIHQLVRKAYTYKYGDFESEPIRVAAEYFKAKYPKIFNLASEIHEIPEMTHASGIHQKLMTGGSRVLLNPNILFNNSDAVKTLGHELTHAVQARGKDIYWNAKQFALPYMQRPFEIQARKGGTTALKTYEKFLELIK